MATQATRILKVADVETITGHTRQTIWRWYKKRDFPRPFYIGQARCWYEDDVVSWIKSQAVRIA